MAGRDVIAAGPAAFERAAAVIAQGGVVALPTDTFYGLAADPAQPEAVARLAAMKGRPPDKPFPLLIAKLAQTEILTSDFPLEARRLAQEWWPGPLTLLLPAAPDLPAGMTGGSGVVGLRVAKHPAIALTLAALGGGPITGTSANQAGDPPPRTVTAVQAGFPEDVQGPDLIVDGGLTRALAASTIVDCTTAPILRVVREGAIPGPHVRQVASGNV